MPPPADAPADPRADAATAAQTAADDILNDTPVHPDDATWDDAVNGRIDHFSNPTTPRGILLTAVSTRTSEARRAAAARNHRAAAEREEAAAIAAAHQLTAFRAAIDQLPPTTTPTNQDRP